LVFEAQIAFGMDMKQLRMAGKNKEHRNAVFSKDAASAGG
jgi:hypothetical protein